MEKGEFLYMESKVYQRPRGTVDILPGDSELWQKVEGVARKTFNEFGYSEIRTPIFEDFNVFARNVGETSDIVEKQMYDFEDKGKRHISLRPEGTAGVVRAYVQNKLFGPEFPKPYKVYYMGSMFRYERPESGRQRQFTQIGCEAINSESPQIDAEVILEALLFFKRLGINNLRVAINTLGDSETRDNYRRALIGYLKPFYEKLSNDSKRRLYKNPLRILDSKDSIDKKIVENAPSILETLSDYSAAYLNSVKNILNKCNVNYVVDEGMVRGLDYYTHTIFEIMSNAPAFGGGYTTICGGGHYNGLISQLGGPNEEGIGYGIGVERLLLLLKNENKDFVPKPHLDVFFVTVNEKGDDYAFLLMEKLREKGIKVDKDYQNLKLSTQIKEAQRHNTKYFIVVGDREAETGQVELVSEKFKKKVRVSVEDFIGNPSAYLI